MFNDNGSFLLALFEFFLFFAWFMCLFWIFGDIFRSKDLGGVARTLWVLFVIFVPWLGILVYLIARGRGMQERQLEQAIQMQRAQTEYIKSVAGSSSTRRRRSDRVGEGSARQRSDHPGRVRAAQGEGPRHLNAGPPNSTVRYSSTPGDERDATDPRQTARPARAVDQPSASVLGRYLLTEPRTFCRTDEPRWETGSAHGENPDAAQ